MRNPVLGSAISALASFSLSARELVGMAPDDTYRFARGELLKSSHGIPAQLQPPLEFLLVADHADNLGLTLSLKEKNKALFVVALH